ncbi:MAG: MFS transporter [Bifidobacterium tibiigranuli]|uniref:MFS transporter n=1 Tax=Bifidobacterium tibiigranuli TaxID=2172043 RepID=UPI0026F0A52D|nr:MFS transporter [Bifidobacterium tibiigranuli]MCI1673672.1 MFS transporter [Bifidobacterium tibiigranuli]MCI1712928.1 MFS transporter [Bifidobacterium tibiigranuli]MCI1833565.1 MFS transporter [Bifidobacterium tibiigranuli]
MTSDRERTQFLSKYMKRFVLLSTTLSMFIVFASTTSVNVILPDLYREFPVASGTSDWYLLAYMLVTTVLIPVFARLSDLLGRRTIFLVGMALAIVSSSGAALSSSAGMLIAWRAAQGIGAAIILTNANALLADVFPSSERAGALGINVMAGSVAGALGPVLGGAMLDWLGWRSVFLINVPFGLLALLVGALTIPAKQQNREIVRDRLRHFDVAGAVLSMLTLGALLLGINRVVAWGVTDVRVISLLVAMVILGVGFVLVERKIPEPLVDLKLLTDARRWPAYSAVFCISVPQSTIPVLIALYLQGTLRSSAVASGTLMLCFAVTVAVVAPLCGRLATRFGNVRPAFWGGAIFSLGLIVLGAGFLLGGRIWVFSCALLICGVGNGLFHTPNIAYILDGIPGTQFGAANGVRSVIFNSSQTIGTAVIMLLLTYVGNPTNGEVKVSGALAAVGVMLVCAIGCAAFTARLMPASSLLQRFAHS